MTTIIDWPRAWWGVRSCQFYIAPRSQKSSSPWTQRQNIYGPHVQYWVAKLSFPALEDSDAPEREALIESLGGSAGLLRMGHPTRLTTLYNDEIAATSEAFSDGTHFSDGTGWISGRLPPVIYCVGSAARGETSVIVGGLPASTSRVLRRGDLVEFQRGGIADETPSLHRIVTSDVPTDASGEARIEFRPPLRKGLVAGDSVVLDYATTVFRLMDDDQGVMDRSADGATNVTGFSLVEALL